MTNEQAFPFRYQEHAEAKPMTYDLPPEFRIQVARIWENTIGFNYETGMATINLAGKEPFWKHIHDSIAQQKGTQYLTTKIHPNFGDHISACLNYLTTSIEVDWVIYLIEVSFNVIEEVLPHAEPAYPGPYSPFLSETEAIDELNRRFRQHNIGYRYESGRIIKLSSEHVHEEVTQKTLNILAHPNFQGANQEFLNAHRHYQNGDYKEATTEASKALESTIITICNLKNWQLPKNQTLQPLVKTLIDNNLIPLELESYYSSLRGILQGIGTIRNNRAAHGQGQTTAPMPRHLAEFALNSAAVNILYLVEAYKET